MRKFLFLSLTALLSAPAFAWVPKLDEATAKTVIDGAYGRRDVATTYQTLDLNVKDGKFAAGDGILRAIDGGEACVAGWLAAPTDYSKGSRLSSITLSGQADQLYFQAQDARDNFKNLSAADALSGDYAAKRLPDGELRVDIGVRGLPSEKARDAYTVRLKAADGKMLAPSRKSFVSDWKQEGGTWQGTLVYYFRPQDGGVGPNDKAELLVRTEADTSCAYSVALDLSKFQ